MKTSKLLQWLAGMGAALVLTSFVTIAYATANTWHLSIRNSDDTGDIVYDLDQPGTGEYHVLAFDPNTLHQAWLNPTLFKQYILDPYSYVTTSGLAAAISGFQPQINTLSANAFNPNKFFGKTGSTTPYVASTTPGLMSGAMVAKLNAVSTSTKDMATTTRSFTTSTGATGFQISPSRDSLVNYNATVVTTATIGGNSQGRVMLEIASSNSATSSDWTEIARCTNGQSISLAIVLQLVNTQGCQIGGFVPAGYWSKLRTVNDAGSPSFTYNSGQEVLL